jgi:CRISPR system Cascade subunit CasC
VGIENGIRTTKLPDVIHDRLVANGVDDRMALDVAKIVARIGTGKPGKDEVEDGTIVEGTKKKRSSKKEKDVLDDAAIPETGQSIFFSAADVEVITSAMLEAITDGTVGVILSGGDKGTNVLKAFWKKIGQANNKHGHPPDIALFGRMTTSDALVDVDASTQFAHAFSTHTAETEYDYFTTADDIKDSANMIGNIAYTGACLYTYASIDVNGLAANLLGVKSIGNIPMETTAVARNIGKQVIDALLRAIIYETPTGKQNSFAAHNLPSAILIEVRPKKVPVSYANAFITPVPTGNGLDVVRASISALAAHAMSMTRQFALESSARLWFVADPHSDIQIDGTTLCDTIPKLCELLKANI